MVNKTASAEHEERTFKNGNNGPEFTVTQAAFASQRLTEPCTSLLNEMDNHTLYRSLICFSINLE